jgi:hypothetical protein
MRRNYIVLYLFIILACGISSVFAGDNKEGISGEIEGIWRAGTSHFITGYSYVPMEKRLIVEEDVEITFTTTASFDIIGALIVNGTESSPVVIHAPDGWEGINFTPGRLGIDSISYLNVGSEGGIPKYVIRATERCLKISGCIFVSDRSCLWVSRGRIWADDNFFLSVGRFSATVRFDSLISDRVSPWDPVDANYLTNSIVMADVPDASLPPTLWRFTTALQVEASNEVVVSNNSFKVVAPGYAYGVFYGEPNYSSATGASMQYCVIAVRSYNVQARGVVNQYDGYLDLRRCTIDVGGGMFDPIGVSATNSAQTTVNSCILNLSSGDNFCVASGAARVTVMHTDIWQTAASLNSLPPEPGDDEEDDLKSDILSVSYGEGNIEADPEFIAQAPWGLWNNVEDVRAYYSLSPTSPCIDNGDAALDNDPDNTPADIGRYYYAQMNPETAPSGRVAVPQNLILSPYPNPFNAMTVIPFSLEHAGKVRLTVYDILGRPVAELANGQFAAGSHIARFHARGLPSGMFFVTMELNGVRVGYQKLMLIR